MSGIEIIGVVASIVQIADLGGRLSVKLCTFCHKFKNANKALRYLSKDVALTCNVLRQLGDSLGQDDLACLYSPDAFETAQDVLRECEQVFQDLESAIEQHYPDPLSQSRIDKVTRKFKFLMNESHLDTVAGNLERLKSTMLLMLNVVIYAGQIRRYLQPYLSAFNKTDHGIVDERHMNSKSSAVFSSF
jgi:predicted transcriptional regulator